MKGCVRVVISLNQRSMSEREKQIQFLKALICREHSGECQAIRQKIVDAERQERYIRRMIFLLIVLLLLCLACLCYTTLFWPEVFRDPSQLLVKFSCSVGLASFICLVVFSGYWLWCRWLLNGLYQECRQLIITTVGSRSKLE
jgi:hypothetical protein